MAKSLKRLSDTLMAVAATSTYTWRLGAVSALVCPSAERRSKLHRNPLKQEDEPEPFRSVVGTWFAKFFTLLHEGVGKQDVGSLFDKVSFVIFNYDRCVEHFLVRAIKAAYAIQDQAVEEAIQKLRIIHPYGAVGPLPWQASRNQIPFAGHEGRPDLLLPLSQGIRTYTEQVEEGDTLAAIRDEVSQAETIVFLGFAFHKQNMELITPTTRANIRPKPIRVYATAHGMSQSDCEVVKRQINSSVDATFKTSHVRYISVHANLKCTGLFDEYWRTLAMG